MQEGRAARFLRIDEAALNRLTVAEALRLVQAEREGCTAEKLFLEAEVRDAAVLDKWLDLFSAHAFSVILRAAPVGETDSVSEKLKQTALAAEKLRVANIPFTVEILLTGSSAVRISEVYACLTAQKLFCQQYVLPSEVSGTWEENVQPPTAEGYRQAMMTLFDRWREDRLSGAPVRIREMENLMDAIRGVRAGRCGLCGDGQAVTVAGAGGIHALCTYAFERKQSALSLPGACWQLRQSCRACRWVSLCHGGCRNMNVGFLDAAEDMVCQMYGSLFSALLPQMLCVMRELGHQRGAAI